MTISNCLEWKRKDFMMAKNKNLSIAFYERYLLTVEETAAYFHIRYKKRRNMVKDYEGAKREQDYDQERAV